MPGDAGAKRSVGTGWYRCWVKVPDNWATLGGRDLWVESVTVTIDSSHTAHEAFINGPIMQLVGLSEGCPAGRAAERRQIHKTSEIGIEFVEVGDF